MDTLCIYLLCEHPLMGHTLFPNNKFTKKTFQIFVPKFIKEERFHHTKHNIHIVHHQMVEKLALKFS